MRGRLGLMLGFGAGYVLGAKAGNERYEQLRRLYDNLTASPTFQDAAGKAKEAANTGLGQAKGVASQGVSKVSGAVKKDNRSNLSVAPAPAQSAVPPPTH
ncbi:hypothetical protein BH18ACT15_BH18ACT15_05450 [soil metagenome]